MIAVVDYGAGNLRSVVNLLAALGAEHRLVDDGDALHAATSDADKVLLPGVGHFRQIAAALDERSLRRPLRAAIDRGLPFLGICLGAQILFDTSDEAPGAAGLGVLPGCVTKIVGSDRLPHMGWNTVTPITESALVTDATRFYFANTFCCPVVEQTTATTHYGQTFSAIIEHRNAVGIQFHPEKSGAAGIEVMRRWAAA